MAMTKAMKRFIMGRGITALTLAERCGLVVKRDIYDMLNGFVPPSKELHDVLCGIYGMTEQEFQEAMPERRKRHAKRTGTDHQNHTAAADAGGT